MDNIDTSDLTVENMKIVENTDLIEIFGGSSEFSNKNEKDEKINKIAKDDTIADLIPNEITECSLTSINGATCMSVDTVQKIGKIIHIHDSDPTAIVAAAKTKLQCETERCVLTNLMSELGEIVVRREINVNLKVVGPTDAKLLSNVNIDNVMKQWGGVYKDFFPYNFNMLNYASYSYSHGYVYEKPDTLATIHFGDLYAKNYRCAGCIINSDVYQRDGKHWMALFVDLRNVNITLTVEFFNSSGNNPAPEFLGWMEKTKLQIERIFAEEKSGQLSKVETVKVSSIRHQQSKSECGLYSLFYIWARLNGVSYKYFAQNPIHDSLMFEFRAHIFEDPSRKRVKKFNWSEYQKNVSIEWEK